MGWCDGWRAARGRGKREGEERGKGKEAMGRAARGKRRKREGRGGKMAGWAGPKGEKREGKERKEKQMLLSLKWKFKFKWNTTKITVQRA
jgi:hypothetical protein